VGKEIVMQELSVNSVRIKEEVLGETIDCLSTVVRRDSYRTKHAKPLGRCSTGWGKSKKIPTTTNKIWPFSMPDSSLSRGTLLGRAYSVDNQSLGDSYEVLCPLKFRRLLPRIASYAGAVALNFRRSVPGKSPYPGAWPLNFRGYCPESHPK